jgi:hypothetical protein
MMNENDAAKKGSDCVSIYSHTPEMFLTVLQNITRVAADRIHVKIKSAQCLWQTFGTVQRFALNLVNTNNIKTLV